MKERTPAEPLRGEAAYRARKAEIAKRNDSARADGAARRERSNLPRQPHP